MQASVTIGQLHLRLTKIFDPPGLKCSPSHINCSFIYVAKANVLKTMAPSPILSQHYKINHKMYHHTSYYHEWI